MPVHPQAGAHALKAATMLGKTQGDKALADKAQGNKARRDKPWIFRTYAGHSTARASNDLYRNNLG